MVTSNVIVTGHPPRRCRGRPDRRRSAVAAGDRALGCRDRGRHQRGDVVGDVGEHDARRGAVAAVGDGHLVAQDIAGRGDAIEVVVGEHVAIFCALNTGFGVGVLVGVSVGVAVTVGVAVGVLVGVAVNVLVGVAVAV